MSKTYTVVYSSMGEIGGKYTSSTGPAVAAKKAASKRFKKGAMSMYLTIRESGSKKELKYQATRVKTADGYTIKVKGEKVGGTPWWRKLGVGCTNGECQKENISEPIRKQPEPQPMPETPSQKQPTDLTEILIKKIQKLYRVERFNMICEKIRKYMENNDETLKYL